MLLKTGSQSITRDEDFSDRITVKPEGPSIVLVKRDNCKKSIFVAWFELFIPDVIERLEQGEKLIIVSS